MNIDICLYVAMVLMCFCVVVLTYKDYQKALASGNERRIIKDKKDLKEAMAIFFVAIVCFILGVFVFLIGAWQRLETCCLKKIRIENGKGKVKV